VGLLGRFDRKLVVGGELGGISTLEVVMRSPEVFVRPLSHEEAALAPGCARFVPAASIEADQMIGAGLGRAHCGNDW
jgi:hypothetical protein